MEDGSSVLKYDSARVAAFDLFILERPGAEGDYSPETLDRARSLFQSLDGGGPPCAGGFHPAGASRHGGRPDAGAVQDMLKRYEGIDDARLRQNLYDFLNEIMPVCEETGIRIAIHPTIRPGPSSGLPPHHE